jgi:dynein light intermediate chain 1
MYRQLDLDGASLVYTSIRNNCNLNLLYEYMIHRAYSFPFRFRSEPLNEEAIFLPFGYDKPALIKYQS